MTQQDHKVAFLANLITEEFNQDTKRSVNPGLYEGALMASAQQPRIAFKSTLHAPSYMVR